jgi:hypothetical protein
MLGSDEESPGKIPAYEVLVIYRVIALTRACAAVQRRSAEALNE